MGSESKSRSPVILFMYILAAAGMVLYFTTIRQPQTDTDRRERYCDNRSLAHSMAQEFITSRLKAPATALFPTAFDDGVSIIKHDQCSWRINSYVDAQNSFGANIRQKWRMVIHYNPSNDRWRASAINMN